MSPIIIYTEDEIKELFNSLTFSSLSGKGKIRFFDRYENNNIEDIITKPVYHTIYTYISIFNTIYTLDIGLLLEILRSQSVDEALFKSLMEKDPHFVDRNMKTLIHITKKLMLDEIPLYINDFSHIAKWRLRIGK